jgi:hypothetical protein
VWNRRVRGRAWVGLQEKFNKEKGNWCSMEGGVIPRLLTSYNLSTRRKRQATMAKVAEGEEVGRRLKELEAGQAKMQESMRVLTAKMDLILSKF